MDAQQSIADFLADNWKDEVEYVANYQGQELPVKLKVKPSEAVISTNELPSHNNHLLAVLSERLKSDQNLRSKMNGKSLDQLQDVFENDAEFLSYMLEDPTLVTEVQDLKKQEEDAAKNIDRQIVLNCAVNPRFTDFADFERNKSKYLGDKVKTFPIEFLSDFDVQQMAQLATGKHIVWEVDKAKAIGNFSVQQSDSEVVA